MKCPMKFNNPCCDIDEECDPECAWCLTHKRNNAISDRDEKSCAIAAMVGLSKGMLIPAILVDREEDHD